MRFARVIRSSLFVAAVLARGAPASADSEADRLFAQGKAALEAKRYDEACEKLSKSQQLDPATGTLLALALCHEGQGKTATAWRELKTVAEASARDGRSDRVSLARAKIAALEPKLPHVVIAISGAQQSAPDLKVVCDAATVPAAEYNQPLAVDPGDHAIAVTATGKKPWSTWVTASGPSTVTVAVPPLEDETPVARVETPAPQHPASLQRLIGWSLAGVGAASFVVGTIFGIRAAVLTDYAKSRCPASPCSDPVGVGENHDAQASAWVADFGIGLGIAAAAAGVFLIVWKPHAATAGVLRVTPVVTSGGAGAALLGAW